MGAVPRGGRPRGRVVRVEDHGHRHGALLGLDAWRGYGQ
jgi:hypothetical protein